MSLATRVRRELADNYGQSWSIEDIEGGIGEINSNVDCPFTEESDDGDVRMIADMLSADYKEEDE